MDIQVHGRNEAGLRAGIFAHAHRSVSSSSVLLM